MRWFIPIFLSGCAVEPFSSSPDAGPPVTELRDVRFVSSHGSTVFAEGHLNSLLYERDTSQGTAEGLDLRFPRQGGGLGAISVSAPRASGNALDERVTGAGGVKVRAARGDEGQTADATYDGRKGEAQGVHPVEILAAKATLTSPGFHWRAADNSLELGPTQLDMQGRAP